MCIISCLCVESIIEKEGFFFFFFGRVCKARENKVKRPLYGQEHRMGYEIDTCPF